MTTPTTTTPAATRNETALHTAIERWNAGDLEGYLAVYDEGVRLHGLAPEALDKTAVRGFYTALATAFPGSRITIHETLVDGDRISARFTLTGRHEGPFLGVPATGTEIALPGITILHFRDGRCVERWTTADMLGLLVQIGAVPPPS